MTNHVYVLGGLAHMLLDFLDEQALDLASLRATLQRVKISERVHMEVWWDWLDVVERAMQQPGVGFLIGRCAKTHHIGLLGYLTRACPTMGDAFERFSRYQPLLHNLNPISVRVDDERVHMSWDPEYGISVQIANEVLLSAVITFIQSLTGVPGNPALRIGFPRPSPYAGKNLDAVAGCPVVFGAKSLELLLPREVFDRPLSTADRHLRELLEAQAEWRMETTPQPDRFVEQLHDAIRLGLPEGRASGAQIASVMNLPLRTFYRRLEQRGVNYRDHLRSLRYRLAKQYLGDRDIKLADVAGLVGYADQSTFSRAFKSWNGSSPHAYRLLTLGERDGRLPG